ncbi:B-cell scaffold protein with ankyrin repeats-like [Limanda limanda]|uniref:B-cell scaffold protein with ankyrin repeats-like n=1 Tax=Limanda limanda TaxID=27771 RepID=UPI0029C732D0|nr:B-cell scaffold protein with ankyrin repeats-like [Limanda limanda]
MSHTAEDLLIIYQTEAEPWATYLKSAFTGPIPEAGICCYDIATASSRQDDFLRLAGYSCKILILCKGMLDGLSLMWRFFLARVLSPASQVVVLLCGVDSLTPLLELVPLNGDECLQISSEQDAHEYLSTVTDIVRKGVSARAANVNPLTRKPFGSEQKSTVQGIGCRAVVVPSRVPCGTSTEVFILLENEAPGGDTEVEFAGECQALRVKPVHWNDRALCVNAPDFPAGNVSVTVYINGVPLSKAQLQYYSNMEEIACLLSRVADPVDFMCQALQVPCVEKLDDKLSTMLLEAMPSGGFPARQCDNRAERGTLHHVGSPTLLHFAAQYGLMGVASLLLQCPGADRALHTANQRGQTPAEIARSHGHAELDVLLRKTMNISNPGEDNADSVVHGVMCTADMQKEEPGEDEQEDMDDIYASLGVNDEYETFMNPTKAMVIANRPPAPTPRPASLEVEEDTASYITQVFKKKKTPQENAELYSLLTKQARGREPSISSTYDNLVEMHGLQQLAGLQQRVKAGSLTVDEALERFSDWQSAQKGMDATQEEKLTQLRDVMIKSSEDDDSVYDQIHIVHHAPGNPAKENRRASVPLEVGVYSKPLKQQHQRLSLASVKGHRYTVLCPCPALAYLIGGQA